jgi:subtilase family serine protease
MTMTAGTRVSGPLFAGLAADAAALAGHSLGAINAGLYQMARHPQRDGVLPVRAGCNTDFGITGYCANGAGWNPADIGTAGDAARFIPALAGS